MDIPRSSVFCWNIMMFLVPKGRTCSYLEDPGIDWWPNFYIESNGDAVDSLPALPSLSCRNDPALWLSNCWILFNRKVMRRWNCPVPLKRIDPRKPSSTWEDFASRGRISFSLLSRKLPERRSHFGKICSKKWSSADDANTILYMNIVTTQDGEWNKMEVWLLEKLSSGHHESTNG